MPGELVIGPGQPFLLEATAIDLDSPTLPLSYLWVQRSGPDTAVFDDPTLLEPTVICNSVGVYTFEFNASNGVANVFQNISVSITNVFVAAASYTARCQNSLPNGQPVTEVASYSSTISLEDAQAGALAAAQAAAEAALVCSANVAPVVAIFGTIPTIQATTTVTAACVSPFSGASQTVTYTFNDTSRAYADVVLSSETVAASLAKAGLVCKQVNAPPVIKLLSFDYTIEATATAIAKCSDITSVKFGASTVASKTVTLLNATYAEAEVAAYLAARAAALAGLNCQTIPGPMVTILGTSPLVRAVVTVAAQCEFGNKGSAQLVKKTFTASDYYVAANTALTAAYAEANANLVCTPNVAPLVLIASQGELNYDAPIAYRNNNTYRSAISTTTDFVYTATVTATATCPAGSYGPGTYAVATGTAFTNYSDAVANATALAEAEAQAALVCTPLSNRIALNIFNAQAGQVAGNAQVLGIFRLTSGTVSAPIRARFLGAVSLPEPGTYSSRYTDNTVYLDDFSDVTTGNQTYFFYLGRPHADGSYVWIPDSVHLRLDSNYPTTEVTIESITAAPTQGILDASFGAVNIAQLEALNSASLSLGTGLYLAIDPAGWEGVADSYSGVMVLQTDPGITTILNYGLVSLGSTNVWTEKTVVPIPFVPTFTDWTTPLTFVFYSATPNNTAPLGYNLANGWMVGPSNGSGPWLTDASPVAWTYAATHNLPAYTLGSTTGQTVSSSNGNVVLPAATSNVANFARAENVKLILRRYRQKLF
jgi:hypothetical protein